MNRPPFQPAIDSTMRASFVACPTKFWWNYLLSLRPNTLNAHLHFGQCFAKGLECARRDYYLVSGDQYRALVAGVTGLIKHWGDFPAEPDGPPTMRKKTLEACIACLVGYFQRWSLADDMPPLMLSTGIAVELSLSAPLPGVMHPDGGPLYYCGLPDAIVQSQQGLTYVRDEKTTGSLGAKWADKWRMRGQFPGYVWLSRQNGFQVHGVNVRGVAPMTFKVDLAECDLHPADWEIDRWLWQVTRDAKRMIACWEAGAWDIDLSDTCSSFGGCEYLLLCTSQNPYEWITPNFKVEEWKPWEGRT